jgi:hypothetical protein
MRKTIAIAVLMFPLFATAAHAAMIHTNEWNNVLQAGWSYSSGYCECGAVIDNSTSTPSGGGALKFIYPAGTYTQSIGGGRAEFDGLTGRDYYVGHWVKFSPGFVWHPIGTKIDYQYVNLTQTAIGSQAAFTIRVDPGGRRLALDITIQGNGQFVGLPHTIYSNQTTPIVPGQWQWLEYHVKLNDVLTANPNVAEVVPNGVLEVWIDDMMQANYNNLRFTDRQGQTWKRFQHSPEYGGGGSSTIPTTQYLWVGHTVISTTRIGRPFTGSSDTTPPGPPRNLLVSKLMDSLRSIGMLALQWFTSSEAMAAR